jgi:hypothetical protein
VIDKRRYWLDALPSRLPKSLPMRRAPKVIKLSDEFSQYELILKCGACGHERRIAPRTLANFCGWDARLEEVAQRLQCSKCGRRQCSARAVELTAPRGYKSH